MVLFLIAGGVLLGASRHAGVVLYMRGRFQVGRGEGVMALKMLGRGERSKQDGGGPNEGHEEEREEKKHAR